MDTSPINETKYIDNQFHFGRPFDTIYIYACSLNSMSKPKHRYGHFSNINCEGKYKEHLVAIVGINFLSKLNFPINFNFSHNLKSSSSEEKRVRIPRIIIIIIIIGKMSKGDKVVVLDFWASPFCARVKIALEEKGVDHVDNEEDIFGKKSELLLKSNPIHQKVPVLLHNDKPVLESSIIVSYIDHVWSSNSLLPDNAYDLAKATFWADFIDKKVGWFLHS